MRRISGIRWLGVLFWGCLYLTLSGQSKNCYTSFLDQGLTAWDRANYPEAIHLIRAASHCADRPSSDSSDSYLIQIQREILFNQRLQVIQSVQDAAEALHKAEIYDAALEDYEEALLMLDSARVELLQASLRTQTSLINQLDSNRDSLWQKQEQCRVEAQDAIVTAQRMKAFQQQLNHAIELKEGGARQYLNAFEEFEKALQMDSSTASRNRVRYHLFALKAETEGCIARQKRRVRRKRCFTRNNFAHTNILRAELDYRLSPYREESLLSYNEAAIIQSKVDLALNRRPNYYLDPKNPLSTSSWVQQYIDQRQHSYFGRWEAYVSFSAQTTHPLLLTYAHTDDRQPMVNGRLAYTNTEEVLIRFYLSRFLPQFRVGLQYRFRPRWQINLALSAEVSGEDLRAEIVDGDPMHPAPPQPVTFFTYYFPEYRAWQLPVQFVYDIFPEDRHQFVKKRRLQLQLFMGAEISRISTRFTVSAGVYEPVDEFGEIEWEVQHLSTEQLFRTTTFNWCSGIRWRLRLARRKHLFLHLGRRQPLQKILKLDQDDIQPRQDWSSGAEFPNFTTSFRLNQPNWFYRIGFLIRFSKKTVPLRPQNQAIL